MRCPHPRLLHSHREDAPAGLQLHMLLMGSARSCGYCSTTTHHLGAHVERGFSRALFRRKDEFPRKKQSQQRMTQKLQGAGRKDSICSRLVLLLRSPFQLPWN